MSCSDQTLQPLTSASSPDFSYEESPESPNTTLAGKPKAPPWYKQLHHNVTGGGSGGTLRTLRRLSVTETTARRLSTASVPDVWEEKEEQGRRYSSCNQPHRDSELKFEFMH